METRVPKEEDFYGSFEMLRTANFNDSKFEKIYTSMDFCLKVV